MSAVSVRVTLGAVFAALMLGASAASAQDISAPVVIVDRHEVPIGEEIVATIDGFVANFVTISICGNEARRGSTDCNMRASQSREVRRNGTPTVVQLIVEAPPAPCPCLVRVSDSDNQEVAIAPIIIIGHPTAPVVGNRGLGEPLVTAIIAEPATEGIGAWLRASLGGSVEYDVTMSIRNGSTELVDGVVANARVGGGGDDVDVTIEIEPPSSFVAGQAWEDTVRFALPAPVIGSATWRIDVSSDSPTVSATDETSHLPGLLLLFAVILGVDVVVLAIRWLSRLLRRRRDLRDEPADDEWSELPPVVGAVVERPVERDPVQVG